MLVTYVGDLSLATQMAWPRFRSTGPFVKISTLYVPVFLLVMLLFCGLTWSTIDSQAAADSGAEGVTGLINAKFGLLTALPLVAVFVARLGNPLRAAGAALALFFCLAAASVLWTFDTSTTLFTVLNLTLLLVSTILAQRWLGFTRALRLVWLFGVALILVSVVLAAIGDQHAMMSGMHAGRWRGLFAHKNSFGQFLAVNLLISAFGRSSLKLPALLVYPMILVDAFALVMANSATADIGAAAGLVAGIAFLPIRNRSLRNLWRLGAVTVAGVLAMSLLLQPEMVNTVVGRDDTMNSRGEMWAQAVPLTFQHPLGTGYGTAGGSQTSIELQKRMHRTTNLTVQSGYINAALELGWISVALYLVWAGSAVGSALFSREATAEQTLLVALLALHAIESISEVNGCFLPSWLLLMVMLPMVEIRSGRPPRFRFTRRKYTSVAPANARAAAGVPA